MKALAVIAVALALSTPAFAEDAAGPADKTDAGSLSAGAKAANPAAKPADETAPADSATSGASSGDAGAADTKVLPGTKKGMGGSDPSAVESK